MSKVLSKENYSKNVELANKAAFEYYTNDNPIMSDSAYDQLLREITEYENATNFISKDSPTNRVGDKILDGFVKAQHINPMMSIQDVFNEKEFNAWKDNIIKKYPEGLSFTVEPKYDGLSLNIIYQDGKLSKAITRGDGKTGEDVTQNALYIQNIPANIPYKGKVEIRGEVVILKENFEKINSLRLQNGKNEFANERNAAAGSLRNYESKYVKMAKLRFYPYGIGHCDTIIESHSKNMDFIHEQGFVFDSPNSFYTNVSFKNAYTAVKEIEENRDNFKMCLDGAVIKVDSLLIQKQLGAASKVPKWCVAFKFKAQEETSFIRNITWQVGKTGTLTPVAEIDPVDINGATVRRATLNNLSEIERLDVRINDQISIIRSGDVIPKIIGSFPHLRKGDELKIQAPTLCPTCGHEVENRKKHGEDEIKTNIYCSNKYCPDIVKQKIIYAVSRDVLNITSLGESAIKDLVDMSLIADVCCLYSLSINDLLQLDGFSDKKSKKIFDSIQNTIGNTDFSNFINSLNIELIGKRASKTLTKSQYAVNAFLGYEDPDLEEFLKIEDFGDAMANNLYMYLTENRAYIDKMLNAIKPIIPDFSKNNDSDLVFLNKTFVITGTFVAKRSDIVKKIESLGGKVTNSISKNKERTKSVIINII